MAEKVSKKVSKKLKVLRRLLDYYWRIEKKFKKILEEKFLKEKL